MPRCCVRVAVTTKSGRKTAAPFHARGYGGQLLPRTAHTHWSLSHAFVGSAGALEFVALTSRSDTAGLCSTKRKRPSQVWTVLEGCQARIAGLLNPAVHRQRVLRREIPYQHTRSLRSGQTT